MTFPRFVCEVGSEEGFGVDHGHCPGTSGKNGS